MASEHASLVYKFKNRPNSATTELRRSVYFKGMVVAIAVAFTTILVRTIPGCAKASSPVCDLLLCCRALVESLRSRLQYLILVSTPFIKKKFI